MNTFEDYLNDYRLISAPDMKGALEPVVRLHAIRLMIQDETAGMSPFEEAAYHRCKTNNLFASLGLPPPQYSGCPEYYPSDAAT